MFKRRISLFLAILLIFVNVFVCSEIKSTSVYALSASELTSASDRADVSSVAADVLSVSDKVSSTDAFVSGSDAANPAVSESDPPQTEDASKSDIENDVSPSDQPSVPEEPEVIIPFEELSTTLSGQSASYNSISLTWDAIDGATSYEVWVATGAKATYKRAATVETTSYRNGSRVFNKTYYYKVRGMNADGTSAFSNVVSVKTIPATPSNFKAVRSSYKSIKLSWSKVPGASGYAIYRASSENGKYTLIRRITRGKTTSYTNTSLTCGKTYYYKIRAYRNVSGKRIYSKYTEVVSASPYLSKPSTPSASRSSYKILIKWKAVSGAKGYKVWRATEPEGEFKLVKTITKSSTRSFYDSSVVPGTTYYYKITATRSGSQSDFSNVRSYTSALSKPSSPKAASASYNSVKVTWGGVTGASGYIVWRSDSLSGIYQEIARTSGKSYVDSGLNIGQTYYYKISAYRTAGGLTGSGSMSSAASAAPVLSTASSLAVKKNSDTSLKVSWKSVSGADGYYVYRAASSGGTYSLVATLGSGDETVYIDENRTVNRYYYYKVRAYRSCSDGVHLSKYTSAKSGRITKKIAYLTFDDGPSSNTMKILNTLDKYDVKATFFVNGKTGRDAEYKAIVDRGHTIALHTYSHNYSKVYKSESAFYADMDKLSDKIYDLTGVRSNIIRFPGGSSNTVYKKYCPGLMAKLKVSTKERGYIYHDWNVSSGDASGSYKSKTQIYNTVKKGVGSKLTVNILMHDSGSKDSTVAALPNIIKYLKNNGYEILPITEDSVVIQH